MNCNCIETVNKELAKRNLELNTALTLTGKVVLTIPTRWKDESKKPRGKKPGPVIVTNCPFCGVEVEERNNGNGTKRATAKGIRKG